MTDLCYIQEQISEFQLSGGQSAEAIYIFEDIKRVFKNLKMEEIPAKYRTKFLKVKSGVLAHETHSMREPIFTKLTQLLSTIAVELQELITAEDRNEKSKHPIGFHVKQ
jgi:hypothetical protein